MVVRFVAVGRKLTANTPSRLRFHMMVVMVAAGVLALSSVLVGVVASGDANQIRHNDAALIVNSRTLQTELAKANAAAAATLLDGADNWDEQRAEYDAALVSAATALESAVAATPDDDATNHERLTQLMAIIPQYAGLVEAARANNRQGFPTGAAYLDTATEMLESEIFPLTDEVANDAAASYRSRYDRHQGLMSIAALVLLLLTVGLLVYLVQVQAWMSRWFRRTINLGVMAATVVVLVAVVMQAGGLVSARSTLEASRQDGYLALRDVLEIRSDSLAARTDESRFLIARGAGSQFEDTFQRRSDRVQETLGGTSEDTSQLLGQWDEYLATHDALVATASSGDHSAAVDQSVSAGRQFDAFDQQTQELMSQRRQELETLTEDVVTWWRRVLVLGPIAAIVAAAMAVLGLQQRRAEYR